MSNSNMNVLQAMIWKTDAEKLQETLDRIADALEYLCEFLDNVSATVEIRTDATEPMQ